jgi:hypothetical protein
MRAALLMLALATCGCPNTVTPPDGNTNDNTDPPPTDPNRVEVTILGQGTVNQNADGDLIVLLAVPAANWEFDRWSNAAIDDVLENPVTVDLDTVPSISVTFLRADSDDDGVPDISDDCTNTPTGSVDVNERGCAPAQRDTDGDGINDAVDQCERTPSGATIDAVGCPVGDPTTGDDDADGVSNDIDQCADTPAGAEVDANGCAKSQRDTDGDGVTDDRDRCPNTSAGTDVDNNGCTIDGGGPPPPPPPATCGNGTLDSGEECDGTAAAACPGECRADCTCPPGAAANDNCANARLVSQGTQPFSSLNATTDGVAHPGICSFFSYDHIESDVWFRYIADCSGPAIVSLCGSDYDTKLAVYRTDACPPVNLTACDDDGCGTGTSRVEFTAVAGQTYTIRVGGFEGDAGDGQLTILCNVDTCQDAAGDCFTEHGNRGCADAVCCNTTCDKDPYCCDVEWDDICAQEAAGLCTGSFAACTAGAGTCGSPHAGPGCNDVECCNAVCLNDPFCCVDTWDELCVDDAGATCFLTCGGQSGSCFQPNGTPGCQDVTCCEAICAEDSLCCSDSWDQVCADIAATTAACR